MQLETTGLTASWKAPAYRAIYRMRAEASELIVKADQSSHFWSDLRRKPTPGVIPAIPRMKYHVSLVCVPTSAR